MAGPAVIALPADTTGSDPTDAADRAAANHVAVIGRSTDDVQWALRRLGPMTRLGSRLSPILIGRDELFDLAERRRAEVTAGRGQFLLLAGEAGIGKSRFMAAVEKQAEGAGFRTAGGFLAPQDRDVPAESFLDMARSMTRYEPWVELGRRLLALVDETVAAPQPRRRALVLKIVDLLVDALDDPTMLSFDDLQWADNLSLEILTELARATRDRPLLIMGAYRVDELTPDAHLREWRARLLTQRMAEEARLTPLDREQTALMTTLILGTGLPAPRDVVDAVYARTDGVPLHIEELLGAIAEDERTDSRVILDAAVPDTLEDVILQRIARLSPEAQAVARSGAVIGRCFVPEVLAGIMEVPVDSLEQPLRELVDEHVLDPPGLRGLFDYRHQLLRDALYRSLPEGRRRLLHARAGEFGKELEGASEIHASVHYERANMRSQAFRSALQGARVSSRLSSHREAFELYQRAVDNMPADLTPAEQADILGAFAVEAAAIEEIAICELAAGQARELYLRAGDPIGALDQVTQIACMARRHAAPLAERFATIRSGLAELNELPGGQPASRVRAGLSIELAYASIEALDLEGAVAAVDAGRKAARQSGDEDLLLQASSLAGMVEVIEGRVSEGLDRIAVAAYEARDRGFEDTGVTAYRDAAVMAVRVMAYRRAAGWIDEGLRYADAIEQSHCAHVLAATGALVAWADGRWDDAVALGEHALADKGCERAAGMARWPLGYVALGRGDLETATTHLRAAEAFGEASGAPDMRLAASWGLAETALLAGDYEAAVAHSERALEVARRAGERGQFAPLAITGTRARIAAGRPAEAERWLAAATDFLGPIEWHASPALDHAAGLVSLSAGSTGAARESLERAARGWAARGRTWELLWARLDLAGCLMHAARYADAASQISEVREAATRLGSRPLLDRVEELTRLNRRHDAQTSAWHPLTAREFEVARLIASGLTNSEIAAELSVAPRTVSAHVEHILAKLGAGRRTEIASWVATALRATAAAGRPADPEPEPQRERPERAGAPRVGQALSIRR
jgi:DNA-binding CsgD family transcriptional regulator